MAKKVTKIIHIGLYKAQSDLVEKIEADGRSLPEIIRAAIDQYGEKFYPKDAGYVEVAREKLALKKKTQEEQEAWDKLKPEDYARETLKTRVWGGSAWFMIGVGLNDCREYPIELSKIKNITLEDPIVKRHFAIINHEYTWDNGMGGLQWSPEDCEICIKKYNEIMDEKEGKAKKKKVKIEDYSEDDKLIEETLKKAIQE